MLEGVCRASSIVVSFYAGGEVLRGADVETAVSARKHVDLVHLNDGPSTRSFGHSLGAPFDSSQVLWMPLWLAMSERVHRESNGGADGSRTHDLLNAIQALSQLSYGPTIG